jgi:hypothetical protein
MFYPVSDRLKFTPRVLNLQVSTLNFSLLKVQQPWQFIRKQPSDSVLTFLPSIQAFLHILASLFPSAHRNPLLKEILSLKVVLF